jgi:hypothetical protein
VETKTLLIVALVVAALAAAFLLLAAEPRQEAVPATAATVGPNSTNEASAPAAPLAEPQIVTAPEGGNRAALDASAPPSATPEGRVIATYFHNTTRCVTCRTIEQLARQTIESTFAAELASGRLAWRALNMEESANEHYVFDYELTSPSLVLAELDGESELRFKVLSDTWKLVHTKVQFAIYVENEVRAFLEGS